MNHDIHNIIYYFPLKITEKKQKKKNKANVLILYNLQQWH